MNREYCLSKLHTAAHTLMTHPGELPERIQKAAGDLIKFSGCAEFESCYEPIRAALSSVAKGDYSSVTDEQYQIVAQTVYQLCMDLR